MGMYGYFQIYDIEALKAVGVEWPIDGAVYGGEFFGVITIDGKSFGVQHSSDFCDGGSLEEGQEAFLEKLSTMEAYECCVSFLDFHY